MKPVGRVALTSVVLSPRKRRRYRVKIKQAGWIALYVRHKLDASLSSNRSYRQDHGVAFSAKDSLMFLVNVYRVIEAFSVLWRSERLVNSGEKERVTREWQRDRDLWHEIMPNAVLCNNWRFGATRDSSHTWKQLEHIVPQSTVHGCCSYLASEQGDQCTESGG